MKVKTNDKVQLISGKDKGKIGKIVQVFPKEDKVVVEGVGIIKKHLRGRNKSDKGQVLELAAPIMSSKVMLVCPKCDKPTRVGYKMSGDKKVRVCKACEQTIE